MNPDQKFNLLIAILTITIPSVLATFVSLAIAIISHRKHERVAKESKDIIKEVHTLIKNGNGKN